MGLENQKHKAFLFLVVLVGTATLVWFGNGLTPLWPLMWIAPLSALWYSLRCSWWRAALAAAAGWLAGSVNLLSYMESQGAPFRIWMLDFGGLSLMFAMGVLLFRALVLRRAVWSGIIALPAMWVTADWVRYLFAPDGTSADLAYTQLKCLPFVQIASITGLWGITFLLLLAPAAFVAFVHLRNNDGPLARRLGFTLGVAEQVLGRIPSCRFSISLVQLEPFTANHETCNEHGFMELPVPECSTAIPFSRELEVGRRNCGRG